MISIIQSRNFSIYFGTRFMCTNADVFDSVFNGTCAGQGQNHVPEKEKKKC